MSGIEVGVILAAMASSAVVAGVSYYAMSQSQQGSDQGDLGVAVTKTGTNATRNVIYGKCVAGSVNVYNNVRDDNSSKLLSIFTIGVGQLTAIHNLYIDEIQVLTYDKNIKNGGLFKDEEIHDNFNKNSLQIEFRNGKPTETALSLGTGNSDNEWTSAHRGDRVAQVAVLVNRSLDEGARILSAKYSLSALVSGLAVHDPRYHATGQKEFEHSDVDVPPGSKQCGRNPALCLLDYMTDTYYGMGIAGKYIDMASFIDSANQCDANSLKIDAEIDSSLSYSEILTNILSCFDAVLTVEKGLIRCKFEKKELATVFDFTEDNILDSISVTNQSTSNYWNAVAIDFKSIVNKEKQDTFLLPANTETDARIRSFGSVETKSIKMMYTLDGFAGNVTAGVKFVANRVYNKSLFQKQCKFKVDLSELKTTVGNRTLEIFDVVTITNANLDWNKKKFRIVGINATGQDGESFNIATLTLSEYDSRVYDGELDGSIGIPKKDPTPLKPPHSVAFNQSNYVNSGIGVLSWVAGSSTVGIEYNVEYRLRRDPEITWKRATRTAQSQYIFSDLKHDHYDFRVQSVHMLRGGSAWATLNNVNIKKTLRLPAVTGATVDASGSDFLYSWDNMKTAPVTLLNVDPNDPSANGSGSKTVQDYFSCYMVNITWYDNVSGLLLGSKSYFTNDENFNYTLAENGKNGISRQVVAHVYIVSKDGTEGEYAATAKAEGYNLQMPAANVYTPESILSSFIINWEQPEQKDYHSTLIYMSTNPEFIAGSATLYTELVGATQWNITLPDETVQYVRIAHRDVFGYDNLSRSDRFALRPVSIDTLLPDIGDQLKDIRDPSKAVTTTGQYVVNVADGDRTAGIGLYADENRSDVILSADRIMFAGGGHAQYDATKTYVLDQKVFAGNTALGTTSLYKAKLAVPINNPPPNATYWTLLNPNVDQAIFTTTEAGDVVIRAAVINKLTSETVNAQKINGGVINSTSTITAGNGTTSAGLNGDDSTDAPQKDYRIWSGAQFAKDAPFRVDKAGSMTANVGTFGGSLSAASGTFKGSLTAATGTFAGSLSAASGTFKGTLSAANGTFTGTLQGVDGTFTGTIYAENIQGDVVSGSSNAISFTPGQTRQRIFNRLLSSDSKERTVIINPLQGLHTRYYSGNGCTSQSMRIEVVLNGTVIENLNSVASGSCNSTNDTTTPWIFSSTAGLAANRTNRLEIWLTGTGSVTSKHVSVLAYRNSKNWS